MSVCVDVSQSQEGYISTGPRGPDPSKGTGEGGPSVYDSEWKVTTAQTVSP